MSSNFDKDTGIRLLSEQGAANAALGLGKKKIISAGENYSGKIISVLSDIDSTYSATFDDVAVVSGQSTAFPSVSRVAGQVRPGPFTNVACTVGRVILMLAE